MRKRDIILAVVLETFTIYQEEYQQDEPSLVMAVTTDSRDELHPVPQLVSKPLSLRGAAENRVN